MTRRVATAIDQEKKYLPVRFARMGLLLVPIVLIGTVAAPATKAQDRFAVQRPSPNEIQQFAERIFQQQPGYVPGDLVTQRPTQKLLKALGEKGWKVGDQDELFARILKDDDFLAQLFRDEKGREFLGTISNYPGGIDRVDRLSRLPQGKMSVTDLVHKIPNGSDWIKGMTTTRYGEVLGERLSNAPQGHDFNEPTGRIYTLPALAAEIHARLEPAARRASK